ncbi:MAG: hypothetical protein ICV83_08025 [Cytophagales bacterium]|nr:hypothetical protein [Cytophagales bacterium]
MQRKPIWAAILLAATSGLTGCVPPELLEPLDNPAPRERVVVDNYNKYDFIPLNKKTILLNEEFNTNARGWRHVTSSPDYETTVLGGQLNLFTRYTPQQNTISFPELKSTDDFEIEASIKIDYTLSDDGCLLLWGGSTTAARRWTYLQVDDEDDRLVAGNWQATFASYRFGYRTDEFNTYTVRKVKSTYYYFMNGTYLGKVPFVPLDGPVIGFEASDFTDMSVDYLRVKRLML